MSAIIAVATPVGASGIGIVRMSGSHSLQIAQKIYRSKKEIKPNKISFGKVVNPDTEKTIDEIVLLYFKAPYSFTGEDTIEFHCHGNPYIMDKVLDLCLKNGAKLAERGEFTKTAFLNGKIDLTQAEGIYDLINSKTSVSMLSATEQMEGKFSSRIKNIRTKLIKALSHIEAIIDFPDEIDDEPASNFYPIIENSLEEINIFISTADAGKLYREGVNIAIIGKPNVGKSSLLNALLRTDRAIVTDIPGTTRDTLEEYLNIKGVPIRIIDTAGLRHTEDKIEKIGIERSQASINQAQLVLFILDAVSTISKEERELIEKIKEEKPVILVVNKIDLTDNFKLPQDFKDIVFISAMFGRGIEKLEEKIYSLLMHGKTDSTLEFNINQRHKEILYRASESLNQALQTTKKNLPLDFLAIDIKSTIVSMGEIIGENVTDEVIEEIFSNFCVGK